MKLELTAEERNFMERLVDKEREISWAKRHLDPEKYEREYMIGWFLQKKLRQLNAHFMSDQIFAANNADHV
jgi:hypothetical protein